MNTTPAIRHFSPPMKTMFSNMLEFYDQKEHKKALSNSEKILEKYPDHPETVAF